MLQLIRDQATGWIAWGIVILISIPFALWGISDYFGFGQVPFVAEVNGTELSVNEYNTAYQRHRQRLQRLLGSRVDVNQLDEGLLRRQSLDTLVQDTLLVQFGDEDNMRIGDVQLARAIQAQEQFRLDGEFDQGLYENWLRGQGYTSGGFEYDLRRSMLIEQILSGVGGSAIATQGEKTRMAALIGQQRSFFELTINAAQFRDRVVSDEEISEYYASNSESLNTEEAVSLEYVRLSLDELATNVETDEAALQSLYDSSKLNYTAPERRRAAHVLIRIAADANDEAVSQANETLSQLADELDGGATFESLAATHSEDPGSASNGGDLGFFERGIMDPGFEAAVFAMQKGEISEPVRTSFGLHLIQLVDIAAGHTKTFAQARPEISDDYRRRAAEQLYFEQVENLASLAFEVPDTLESAAEALDLEIVRVDNVTRAGAFGDLVAGDPKVVEGAYSNEVLNEGNNSDIIELPNNEVAIVRVVEHFESRKQTLEEARDLIVDRLRNESANTQALREGRSIIERLSSGASREDVLTTQEGQSIEASWLERTNIMRRDAAVANETIDLVFSLPKPNTGIASIDGAQTRSGDFTVVVLTEARDGQTGALAGDELNEVESQLTADYGRLTFDAFVSTLRAGADININDATLGETGGY